jgi:hypothetical protein
MRATFSVLVCLVLHLPAVVLSFPVHATAQYALEDALAPGDEAGPQRGGFVRNIGSA